MKLVSILLSTSNGAAYLADLLDSLFRQTYKNIEIIVRDDSSHDMTLEILNYYNVKPISSDVNLGAKGSFGVLLQYALENSNADYFMFCDQDDIWKPDKVECTLKRIIELENTYENIPLLVHTDLEVVNKNLSSISNSMWRYQKIDPRLCSLNRLLVQNTVTGCTMMINRNLAQLSLPISHFAIMHDWWIGLVASSFGKIEYINIDTIQYRQHGNNNIGTENFNLSYILDKIKDFNSINIDKNIQQARGFLIQYGEYLEPRLKKMLEEFVSINRKNVLRRLYIMYRYDIFKNGLIRNVGLLLKVLGV